MNQHQINAREWDTPANWTRRAWRGVYFSRRDTRAWVRKPTPALGWTVNFAQPRGAVAVVAILVIAALAASLAPMLARG